MRRVAAVTAALAALLAGCGGGEEPRAGADAPAVLTEVRSIETFRRAFEADEGVPRLIVILAPT